MKGLKPAFRFVPPDSGRYTSAMIEIPMTEAQFATAGDRLRKHGLELTAPSGTLTKEGITASYTYGEGLLRITIHNKPFFIPESMIEGRLRSYVEQNMAG